MNGTVSNNNRKYRATIDRTPSGYPRGNAHSSFRGQIAQRDTKPAFHGQAYRVDPFEDVAGVWFDAPKRKAPRAVKETAAKPAKPRTRRQDPGAGTRPSLSKIRSKG